MHKQRTAFEISVGNYWGMGVGMSLNPSDAASNFKYEPAHDKIYKMACVPSDDSD